MSSYHLTTLDDSFRQGYAQIGGTRLHYVESGPADAPLVLLLHGFPECWYSWRHQLRDLSGRYRVLAPDLRGYNLSDKPPRVSDYKMPHLVADVLGLIHHCGRERAAVVGHDWGAAIAWALALAHPDYVSHLAALQVPPPAAWAANLTLKQALRSWYMLFFQLPRVPEWFIRRDDFRSLEKSFKNTVARRGTITDRDIEVYKEALRDPAATTAAVNYYRANAAALFIRRPDAQSAARVKAPTLFIYGERDFAIVPETVRDVGRFVDGPYRELRLKTSNHWVQQEAAEEVSAALRRFLAAH